MVVGLLVFLGLSLLCTVVVVAALAFADRPSDPCWVSLEDQPTAPSPQVVDALEA